VGLAVLATVLFVCRYALTVSSVQCFVCVMISCPPVGPFVVCVPNVNQRHASCQLNSHCRGASVACVNRFRPEERKKEVAQSDDSFVFDACLRARAPVCLL